MENKEKKSFFNPTVIAVVVIVLIIGAFYFGRGSNNQTPTTQTSTELSSQSPASQTTQTETQTSPQQAPAQSLQSQCDVAAKKYFDTWKPTPVQGIETVNLSYQNHYDTKNGGCYVLVNFNQNWTVGTINSLKINYTLVDVFSKKNPYGGYDEIGNYAQSVSAQAIDNRIDTCVVSGLNCGSLGGFMSLVNPYLGK